MFTYGNLRDYFAATLERVAGLLSPQRTLVLLIDGLDQLASESGAQSLSWLPELWPKHVHVVFTTDTADGLSMRNLSNHVKRIVHSHHRDVSSTSVVDDCFFEISPLDVQEQRDVVQYLLRRRQRLLTAAQREVKTMNKHTIDSRSFSKQPRGSQFSNK